MQREHYLLALVATLVVAQAPVLIAGLVLFMALLTLPAAGLVLATGIGLSDHDTQWR